MNYLEKFNRMVKDLSVDEVTLVDGNHWYGDYGCIWDEYNGFHGNPHKLAKTFYKFIEKHWKRALPNKYWKKENGINYKGATISLVLCVGDHNYMSKNVDENQICKLRNGQIYSIEDRYWLNIQESKVLKKKLKKGYIYSSYDVFISELTPVERELIENRRVNYINNNLYRKHIIKDYPDECYDECCDECCDCSDEEYPGSPE